MLEYVTANLFDSPAQTLVNTVNTVGVMGKGIAKQFKQRYPDMFAKYREFCEAGRLTVGKLYLYRTPNKWVLNFPTKQHWRYPSKLEWIEAGLKKFARTYTDQGITSVSFPQLGCGNGELEWAEVRQLMERHLRRVSIPVLVHVASRDVNFVPEHKDRRELKTLREGLLVPREGVGLRAFLTNILELTDPEQIPRLAEAFGPSEAEEPPPLPGVPITTDRGEPMILPGEDFEALWHSLTFRRVVPLAEFPGRLRDASDVVTDLLLQLEYVQPIQFASEDEHGLSYEAGIVYVPVPVTATPVNGELTDGL
jgi:O-acetyl-ADP-ribose deacetylase (regulator of RNase III)